MVTMRFYLHIRKGEVLECEDNEGAEFPALEDAYLEAFASAQELWNALIRNRRDPRQFAFVITGADGVALTELPFGEILDTCRPVLPQPPAKAVTNAVATKERCLETRDNALQIQRASAELYERVRSVHQTISELVSSRLIDSQR
jgi:hypothetical protein